MNQVRLKNALDELGAEYNVSPYELLSALPPEAVQWIPIEDCPKYQQCRDTGVIRNRGTHRVLKPNNSGFVKVRNYKGDIIAMKQGKA
ncbi:hypothetical protein Q8W41_19305 [Vibrio splendidus]|uniref:hypothetical protein n=1 Tax=Vibrio splendidus TaxID=29497 RepID=UPI00273455B6|nr:hypothetical protein [Vibrio splendidus]MDP2591645.1 hypothetical protein [Vibrio splendidus]